MNDKTVNPAPASAPSPVAAVPAPASAALEAQLASLPPAQRALLEATPGPDLNKALAVGRVKAAAEREAAACLADDAFAAKVFKTLVDMKDRPARAVTLTVTIPVAGDIPAPTITRLGSARSRGGGFARFTRHSASPTGRRREDNIGKDPATFAPVMAVVVRLRQEGLSVADIAEQRGCNPSTIRDTLNRAGIE